VTGRREAGFVATEFAFGVAVLVLPVALLVLTFPRWSERQVTARVIGREVARRAARDGVCDRDAARALGATMARNLGVAPTDVSVIGGTFNTNNSTVNIGGNLFQRHGIFHPLASPDPAILACAEFAQRRDHGSLFSRRQRTNSR